MEKEMDDLGAIWKQGKGSPSKSILSAEQIINQAAAKKKSSQMAHYGNIAIMLGMAAVIALFYLVFYPMQTTLSHAGVYMMMAVLIVRSVIEVVSLVKSQKVRVAETTVDAIAESTRFYQFRKRMHGPVTIALVILYILGFFMLAPEYAKHISMMWLSIMYGGFVIIAVVLIVVIRKGIRQEIEDLRRMVELQEKLRE